MPRTNAYTLTAAFLLAVGPSTAQSSPPELNGRFAGWSEIDATGRVTDFVPDGQALPAVTQALRGELAKQVFSPGRDPAGAARPVRTFLTGRYALEPANDGWILRIGELRAGPKVASMVMPRPPMRTFTMGESVWMRTAMTVQADGRPSDIVIEEFHGPQAFLREARDALRKWRFEAESVAGQPIPTVVRQEYSLTLAQKAPPQGSPCPKDTSGRVLAPGQTSCLVVIETRLEEGRPRAGRNHVTTP